VFLDVTPGDLLCFLSLNSHSPSPGRHHPAGAGNLRELRALRLYRNQLIGAIPAQLGALNKRTWLYLSNNQRANTQGAGRPFRAEGAFVELQPAYRHHPAGAGKTHGTATAIPPPERAER
ncbi:unnamed protein product, partial [Ectocarpus sp. 8 AP-2014]